MKKLLLCLPLAFCAVPAHASSTAAWAAFDREVATRCAAASKLDHARAARPVGFDDTLAKVVTLVSGSERVRAKRGYTTITTQKLCVFDQRTKRVWVAEASGWSAPLPR